MFAKVENNPEIEICQTNLEHRDFSQQKTIMFGHVQKVFLEHFRIFLSNSDNKYF